MMVIVIIMVIVMVIATYSVRASQIFRSCICLFTCE
jgi:hypothetical protein